MTAINPDAPILVTGGTGYLAGVIIAQLLAAGHVVHATVRDPNRQDRLAALEALAEASPGSIRYFRADLQDPDAFAPAMAGCQLVIHTASPFIAHVADPQRDLVDPAVEGTRNVLTAANTTASVKRVVLTSSCAAIYGDNADIASMPGGKLTEAVWNTSSTLRHQAYSLSKTLAENVAWDLAGDQSRWDLVTINPSLILGPGIDPMTAGESYALLTQIGDGTMASGIPDFRIGTVDVRDVAAAHITAGFTPQAAGRHILSGHNTGFVEMSAILRDHFGDSYRFGRTILPKFLVWLAGPMINPALTRKMVSRNVGIAFIADNAKSRSALGVDYRPLATTLTEHFRQLIEAGRIKPRR
ncbi:NAD-dependent epimerase/dehydratase family protein [Maricaulis sp.]|uniref:NAD-dependent epimerase/dehydratase family protein n=1 Tax=Maricaulis sp. TaxID=1486257 RepID=UPI002B265C0C|nr:NAD-dependent epimerase/dehydratase family protein [Maricaulis sp.]